MKSQVLLTVWCHISCEAAEEFWHCHTTPIVAVCATRYTTIVVPQHFCLSSLESDPSKQPEAPLWYWFKPSSPLILVMPNKLKTTTTNNKSKQMRGVQSPRVWWWWAVDIDMEWIVYFMQLAVVRGSLGGVPIFHLANMDTFHFKRKALIISPAWLHVIVCELTPHRGMDASKSNVLICLCVSIFCLWTNIALGRTGLVY